MGRVFPRDWQALAALPGFGRSTAITSVCFNQPVSILDGSICACWSRYWAVDDILFGQPPVQRQLWQRAQALLPSAPANSALHPGLMDLSAVVCVRGKPRCQQCPLRTDYRHAKAAPRPGGAASPAQVVQH